MALDYKSSLSRYRRYLRVVREQPLVQAGIWTALSLVLVIAMVVLALRPTLVAIAGLLGQIREDKQIVTKLDDKIVKMQQATGELSKIAPRLSVLEDALPSGSGWDDWAGRIMNIASQSGAQVQEIDVGPASVSGMLEPVKTNANQTKTTDTVVLPQGISGLNFTIVASGDYDQLKQMINIVEGTRRLNVLSSVDFSSVRNKDGGSSLSVNIKGVAAFVP